MSEKICSLYKIQRKDLPKAGAVLTDAFRHDPVWNKVLGPESTAAQKETVFTTPVRYCLRFGEAYAPSENLEGIIGWVPGNLADLTVWRMIRCGAIWPFMKIGARTGAKLMAKMEPINPPLQKDRKEHMKGAPFLYLQIIGVASDFQGKGFGGRLLRALIAESERAGLPVYLETETEPNVRMYEKLGFRVLKMITLPVLNLPMWEMARNPQ